MNRGGGMNRGRETRGRSSLIQLSTFPVGIPDSSCNSIPALDAANVPDINECTCERIIKKEPDFGEGNDGKVCSKITMH